MDATARRDGIPKRIDLRAAPSAMDARAAEQRERSLVAVRAAVDTTGKVLCRCGGRGVNDKGPVPAWFGRDCIEGGCPLKVAA